MNRTEVIERLLDEGLRPVEPGEQGLAYTYFNDEGERDVVWVTDEPTPADAIAWD